MNLVYGLAIYELSVAQVDRAPARCLGGHRFRESCREFRFFLCPTGKARDMLIISFSQDTGCLSKGPGTRKPASRILLKNTKGDSLLIERKVNAILNTNR